MGELNEWRANIAQPRYPRASRYGVLRYFSVHDATTPIFLILEKPENQQSA